MMSIRHPLPPGKFHELVDEIALLKEGFDKVQDHVIITDENAVVLYANNAVLKQTGYAPEEVVGKNPGDLWGGRMSTEFYRQMWHTIKVEHEPYVGEIKNVRKDGTEYWQEIIISPILDKEGIPRFFIGIEPDISDRLKQEQLQKEVVTALAQQLSMPIEAIKGQLKLLSDRGGLTVEQAQLLVSNYGGDRMLIDLIIDLLVFASVDWSHAAKVSLDLNVEIENLIGKVRNINPEVEIEFTKPTTAALDANLALLTQVCLRLISNAAKFSAEEGGRVWVTLEAKPDKYLLKVENNGFLIPDEEKPRMFQRLFRGSEAVLKNKPGVGLGLYIAKLVCDNLGWQIGFASPNAAGRTEFWVEIPHQ